MKKEINAFLILLCSLASFTSCQKEDNYGVEQMNEPGIYLSLDASNGVVSTRALPADDTKINNLYALYFTGTKGSADTGYTFQESEKIELTGTLPITLSNTIVRLKPEKLTNAANVSGKNCKIVFIANMSSKPSPTGKTLKQFREEELTYAIGTGRLQGGTTLIPMYICTGDIAIPTFPYTAKYYLDDAATNGINTAVPANPYSLVRMMAKFTINSSTSATLSTNEYYLKITSISLRKMYTSGLVCYTDAGAWNGTNKRVTSPSLKTKTTVNRNMLTLENATWTNSKQVAATFYTFERDALSTSLKDTVSNCFFEIKGWRVESDKITNVDSEVKTFMLPIPTLNAAGTAATGTNAGPILRNHYYEFTIEKVKDYSLNAKLSVLPWTTASITVDPYPLD